jgi:hypothetical protein
MSIKVNGLNYLIFILENNKIHIVKLIGDALMDVREMEDA